jgi:hypothetical protein
MSATLLLPHAHSFVIGPAVINTHSVTPGSPTLGGLQIPAAGLVVGLAPAILEFWVRFPNERNQGKQGATLCESIGFFTGPSPPLSPSPHANSFIFFVINTQATIRWTIRTFFSPCLIVHIHPHARRIFASSFSTSPPGDRGALHCNWNAIATQPIGLVPFQACGTLPVAEEQSRTRGGQAATMATPWLMSAGVTIRNLDGLSARSLGDVW